MTDQGDQHYFDQSAPHFDPSPRGLLYFALVTTAGLGICAAAFTLFGLLLLHG